MKVLVVEDNEGDFFLVHEYLHSVFPGIAISHDVLLSDASASLEKEQFDVVLLDLSLPDSNGINSIVEMVEQAKGTPVIVLTGFGDLQFAMDSLKLGVQDYLLKDDVNPMVLQKSITYSIERNKISKSLALNEKRFRSLIENSADGLLVIGSDNRIQEISEAGLNILGFESREHLTAANMKMILQEDLDFVKAQYLKIFLEPDQILRTEFRIIDPRNNIIWLEASVKNMLAEPSVNGVVINYRNISDRKMAEENIRISEGKYRYLFDNNPDSIFIFQADNFSILDVNFTASNMLGYSKEAFQHMLISDIYQSEDQMSYAELVKSLNENGDGVEQKIMHCRSQAGETFYIDLALHKIDYNGVDSVLTIGLDVTEKIKLEQKLEEERRRKTREIAEAVITAQERERQELGLELHDNVNQILAGAMMYLGLLKNELKTNSELFSDIEKLIKGAIQEIRKLSHALVPPALKEMELGHALDHIITIAKKTGLFEVTKDLYDFDESSITDAKKLAIYRIVQEQFNNIFKHAKATSILIRVYQEEDKLILKIQDNGVGFSPSKTPQGIGLINIQTRASLFNGTMEINSIPGTGTELVVTFS